MTIQTDTMLIQSGSSNEPVMAGPNFDHILAKLDDPSKDPFEKMIIVMNELMPAITEWKETELAELGAGLTEVSKVTETLTDAQDFFNQLKESTDESIAQNYRAKLDELETEIKAADWLGEENDNTSLKSSLLTTVTAMKDAYDTLPGEKGKAINDMWNLPAKGEETSGSTKVWLDNFNKVGTGLKDTSGIMQAEFQFEVGNYETYIGIYKEMFKNWKGQLQSPLEGIKRGG